MDSTIILVLAVIAIVGIFVVSFRIQYKIIKGYRNRSQEDTQKQMVSIQKTYAIHIFLGFIGICFLAYGIINYDGTLTTIVPSIVGALAILGAIYGALFTRKKIIQNWQSGKYTQDPITYANQRKAGTLCLILFAVLSAIHQTIPYGVGLLLGFVILALVLIYYWILSKKASKNVIVSLLAIFLVIFSLGTYLYLNRQSAHQQSTLATDTVWTDPQGVVQMTIPEGWHIVTSNILLSLQTQDGSAVFNIKTIPDPGETIGALKSGVEQMGEKVEYSSLAGQVSLLITGVQGNFNTMSMATIHNNERYMINFVFDASKSSATANLADYNKMISSFKFLK